MEQGPQLRSLSRGLAVLRTLEHEAGLSLHDLSQRTGLAKPTLLRILRTLEREAYVRRGLTDQLYYVNLRLPPSGGNIQNSVLAEVAGPIMDRLCQKVLWPSDLAIYENGAMRVQETSRRRSPFMLNRAVSRFRIHMLQSAMGRAYLAYCSDSERETILAALAQSEDPLDQIAQHRKKVESILGRVQECGYGYREPGYFVTLPTEARVRAIAVPIMASGAAIGAINLVWIAQAATVEDFAARHLRSLRKAATTIGTEFLTRRPRADS